MLVHDAEHMTYVAERNLSSDGSAEPVNHPMLEEFFERFETGRYVRVRSIN